MEREFDVIVIGAGPAGEVLAGWLSERGDRRDAIVNNLNDEHQLPWLEDRGIELVRGHPRLDGERRVRVGDELGLLLKGGGTVTGSHLLVAVGRRPLTGELGLETVGLEPGRYIEVDDQLRARGHDWLYAVGDVNGRSLLTHSGKYQARIAADHILGAYVAATTDGPSAPRVVFTDPQVAAVGQTLEAALEDGIAAKAIDLRTSGTAGASFHGRSARGTTRFVVDAERELIVGATFVGPDVADMLHAATIAIVAEVPIATLAHAVAPFPTRSELWLKFLEAYESERLALSAGPRPLAAAA